MLTLEELTNAALKLDGTEVCFAVGTHLYLASESVRVNAAMTLVT